MTAQFSIYLDLLRLLAALAVLFSHADTRDLNLTNLLPQSFGHNAVVVFFLLSGYVIAYVADTKEKDALSFWVSRCARIYSVAIPALLLTLCLDWLGSLLDPAFYAGNITTHDYVWVRLLASLSFTNELWLVSIMPFSNSAYWSLCYEMAYYLLFSIWCFAPQASRGRHLLLAALVIGPKILLLAPIWIGGVLLLRWQRGYHISETTGWLLWSTSLAGVVAFQWVDVSKLLSEQTEQWLGPWLYTRLHFSKHFLADYLLALLIAANFLGMRRIAPRFAPLFRRFGGAISHAAGYTFSIYLYHIPILFLATVLTQEQERGLGRYLLVATAGLACTVLLGRITEQRKTELKRWLVLRVLPRLRPLLRARSAP